jgi:hypothetical protein
VKWNDDKTLKSFCALNGMQLPREKTALDIYIYMHFALWHVVSQEQDEERGKKY